MKTKENISNSEMIDETFGLTSYFRTLLKQKNAEEIFNFLLKESGLTKKQMEKRWDTFDDVFGENKNKISALVFSSIIEGRGYLLDEIIKEKSDKNTCIIEVASGFSPRALNLVNNNGFQFLDYIEADRKQVIELKNKFYSELKDVNIPGITGFNVAEDSVEGLEKNILNVKEKNPELNKILLFNEGLLYYLNPEEQKFYFEKIKKLSEKLRENGIELEYLSIDVVTIENFIDGLTFKGFDHDAHEKVNRKVDPEMWDRFLEKEEDFFENAEINLKDVEKYFYDEKITSQMNTGKIEKYKDIPNIENEIKDFLGKDSLYAYSIKL